jgi:D-xylulose kinase
MPEDHLFSIDVGTTSIKVGLFQLSGKLKAMSTQEYNLLTPASNVVELPVDVYWTALGRGIKDILDKSEVHPESILALSLSSQAETLICVDKKGKVLRNAIVWLDARAEEESTRIAKNFSLELLYKTTGLPEMSPIWPAPKILWLKKNEPDVFNHTSKFLIVKDYLIWKLTGKFSTDPTESSSTFYLKLKEKDWWDEMLDFIGIKRDQLPVIFPSYEVVGNISSQIKSQFGLCTNTKVIAGSMDQMAAALGAGNVEPGIITESTGTALAVVATVDRPLYDPKRRVPCAAHCVPGRFVLYPYSETSGIALKWFRDTFPCQADRKEDYEQLLQLASQAPPGAEGLLALPHFTGTACPDFNPQARGAFAGISFKHQRTHFVRALVEAVAFMLRENIDLLENLSIPVKKVRSLGGTAKSDVWLKIKADVLNVPVEVPECSEAASLGAAVLAGVGAKVFSGINQAVKEVVKVKKSFYPEPDNVASYQKIYQNYRSLYQKLYGKT